MMGDYPVPEKLSWDLFLGVAPKVDYHPLYHPFNWRGWVDWGQGALGDMGAHLIDHPVWGLNLGLPTVIETTSTPFNGICYPNATRTDYEFPARKGMPPVRLVWYDGGLMPPRPEELGEERLNGEGGILYVGTKGKMLQNTYGKGPRLLPFEAHNSYGAPKEKLVRIPHESHEMNWVNAIKGKDEASSPVLVRRAPDRNHAPRRRVIAFQQEAVLRRRDDDGDERCGGRREDPGAERFADAAIQSGLRPLENT